MAQVLVPPDVKIFNSSNYSVIESPSFANNALLFGFIKKKMLYYLASLRFCAQLEAKFFEIIKWLSHRYITLID